MPDLSLRAVIQAGQSAYYLGNNSPESMAPIAKQLDDQQIAAIAAYYQQVRSDQQVRDSTDATVGKR